MRKTLLIVLVTFLSRAFASVPVIAPPEGTYADSVEVTITCAGADSVFYTTDRSDPTVASLRYTGPFRLHASSFVNALAFTNGAAGEIVSSMFEITIRNPITVLSPNGGEVCRIGQTTSIRWTANTSAVASAVIFVSVDAGFSWLPIDDGGILPSSSNWGNYQWLVPSGIEDEAGVTVLLAKRTALIKICDYSHRDICDVSDASFTINESSKVQRSRMPMHQSAPQRPSTAFLCNGARLAGTPTLFGDMRTRNRIQLHSQNRSAQDLMIHYSGK